MFFVQTALCLCLRLCCVPGNGHALVWGEMALVFNANVRVGHGVNIFLLCPAADTCGSATPHAWPPMDLADFAGPRRRWVDLMDEDEHPAAVNAVQTPTLRVTADVNGNLLRLYVYLVASRSRDVATLHSLQVFLQGNLPLDYVAPVWVWRWLWFLRFV